MHGLPLRAMLALREILSIATLRCQRLVSSISIAVCLHQQVFTAEMHHQDLIVPSAEFLDSKDQRAAARISEVWHRVERGLQTLS